MSFIIHIFIIFNYSYIKKNIDLTKLKKLGAIAVKQSFEDEGASFEDIKKMRAMTLAANLGLNVKVGWCEARNDISFCKKIGVNRIVASMNNFES